MPNGSSIRNIKRNKSEMATGWRNFHKYPQTIRAFFENLFSVREYYKHITHSQALKRQINNENNASIA